MTVPKHVVYLSERELLFHPGLFDNTYFTKPSFKKYP